QRHSRPHAQRPGARVRGRGLECARGSRGGIGRTYRMTHKYDAIIVGAGQAGPPLAKRLSDAGQSVALIAKHLFGGTCVNTGCIPTKAMVASAYAAHLARRGLDYAVRINGDVRVDMPIVKARKDRMSEQSRTGIEKMLRNLPRGAVYTGHARFQTAH